jgi:hypothetical protein
MPITTYVTKTTGESILPTADGAFYTPPVNGNYSSHQVYVEFFSDAAATTPVTPTAGTVTIAASPTGSHYLAVTNPVITANTVIANGLATYTPPTISGSVYKLRAIFAGITGAAYARVTLWSKQ